MTFLHSELSNTFHITRFVEFQGFTCMSVTYSSHGNIQNYIIILLSYKGQKGVRITLFELTIFNERCDQQKANKQSF